jgi:hypothetical protein
VVTIGPVVSTGDGLAFRNDHWAVSFEGSRLVVGPLVVEPEVVLASGGRETTVSARSLRIGVDDGLLARVVAEGASQDGHELRVTYDLHQTPNLHVYLRFELGRAERLDGADFPLLRLTGLSRLVSTAGSSALSETAVLPLHERWFQLLGDGVLGVGITKLPWRARWNDVGATAYATLANTRLRVVPGAGVALHAGGPLELEAGSTLEAALFLRPLAEPAERVRFEAVHDDPREVVYIPADEREQFLSRQTEDVWLGPPILGGCQNRPADQLIPRSLGMDILAHRRFSWNNEDLSLWRITRKSLYRDMAVKKAYALLRTQNEYGGWFEGVEFYNLPPRHHQHYHSYTSFVYLIDLYDATGHRPFLDAALRSKEFWLTGGPPANSHSVLAPEAWWYRWGGYVNDAGYTDERLALNTHASVLMIMSLLWTRLGDEEARRGLEYGLNGFKLALEQGLQRPRGQFLYSLSQADPRHERPGDPVYIQANLIPDLENVYTVLSAFRLLVANRVARDAAVRRACERALSYFWATHAAGEAETYRSYAVKTYGIAAGELDLRFAFSLPHFLADPDNWTAIYRGFSAWVAPHRRKGLLVEPEGRPPGVESVFLARDAEAFTFALVNTGRPLARLPFAVELDEDARGSRAVLLDPADGRPLTRLPAAEREERLEFELPLLPERSVAVVRLERGS